jgi:hypothetical protein
MWCSWFPCCEILQAPSVSGRRGFSLGTTGVGVVTALGNCGEPLRTKVLQVLCVSPRKGPAVTK